MMDELSQANRYAVPSGVHSFEKKWHVAVRVAARLAHIFPFALPADCVALQRLATEDKLVDLGKTIDPWKMTRACVGHLIKWPTAVHRWRMVVKGRTGQASTTAGLVKLLREVVQWCSGQDWHDMFNRMHGGQSDMDEHAGLAEHASRMGLIASVEDTSEPPSWG